MQQQIFENSLRVAVVERVRAVLSRRPHDAVGISREQQMEGCIALLQPLAGSNRIRLGYGEDLRS